MERTIIRIKDLPAGEFFIWGPGNNKEVAEDSVWIREGYDRATKKFIVRKWSDINKEKLIDGERLVFVDFIF